MACLLLLTACLEEEAPVEVLQLQPASVDLRGKRLAVLPFRGMAGEVWHRQVLQHLEDRGLHVVPLREVAGVAPDMDRSASSVRRLARQLRADWVLEGSTEEIHVNQRLEPTYDAFAGHTRYARQVGLELQANLQVRDGDGGLLGRLPLDASHPHRTVDEVRVQGRGPHDLDWVESLFPWFDAMDHLVSHLGDLTEQVRAATQPRYHRAAWVLLHDPTVAESQQALSLARDQRWSEAADLYSRGLALASGETRAMILYNLGVAQALSGAHDAANRTLYRARLLTDKARLQALCAEALQDNDRIALAREQSLTLGWSAEEGL